jgi:hypothetical protein
VLTVIGYLLFWSAALWNEVDGFFVFMGLLLAGSALSIPGLANVRVSSRHALAFWAMAFIGFRLLLPSDLMDLVMVRVGTGFGVAVVGAAWLASRSTNHVRARILVAALAAVGFGLIALIAPPPGIDIYRVHIEAGQLLVDGIDPYVSLEVPVNPSLPEAVVVGYPYPPINLITYALVASFADPRLVSVVAWVILVTVIAIKTAEDIPRWWLLLYMIVAPAVVPLLVGTFTETLAAALVVTTFVWYQRKPGAIASFLHGIAISSKQHLSAGAPGGALSLRSFRTATWYLLGVAVSLGSGLLISPGGYVNAVLQNAASLNPNPYSASLYGLLGLRTPLLLAVLLAVATGLLVGLKHRSPSLRPLLWSVAVFLFLGSSTIWSHWMLVGWLATFEGLGTGAQSETTPAVATAPAL